MIVYIMGDYPLSCPLSEESTLGQPNFCPSPRSKPKPEPGKDGSGCMEMEDAEL